MAEVLFTPPLYHKVHLSLPWTLFKLAEQISSDNGEIMTMNVTFPNESILCVNVHRKTEAGDEKLVIEVTDSEGLCEQGLVDTDDESWRFDLGSIQSPVFLQKEDKNRALSPGFSMKTETTTSSCKIEENHAETLSQDQIQFSNSGDGDDKIMFISSDHFVQLLETGDVITKNEQLGQDNKQPQVIGIQELIPDESDSIQTSQISGLNLGQEEGSISQQSVMTDVSQTSLSESVTQVLGIEDSSVGHFGGSDEDRGGSESLQLSRMLPHSVVIVEHHLDSHNRMSVPNEHLDNYVVLSSGDAEDMMGARTGLVKTGDAKWNVNDSEIGTTESKHITDLQPIAPRTSEADMVMTTQLKDGPKISKTLDFASELSIMVQSIKDIPRIIVDVEAFKCPVCTRRFYSLEVLSGHVQRLHRGHVYSNEQVEKVMIHDAYLCFICRHPFHRFDAVRKHLESVHKLQMEKRKIKRQNVCPLCLSKHSSLRTLRCHLNYKHHDHPQYKETLVAIHTQLCLEQKPKRDSRILLQCPFCLVNLRFKQFIHHLRIAHQDDPSYEEVLSQSKQAMKEQKRKQLHETTKECKYCHKEFPLTRFYSHLRNIHHTERNDDYKCTTCGKSFHSTWHLNMHRLIHTDEKNQKCEICGHRFRHIYSLKKHKKTIHLKEYPFPCDKCGRGFHTRTLFKSHRCRPKIESHPADNIPADEADVNNAEGGMQPEEITEDGKPVNNGSCKTEGIMIETTLNHCDSLDAAGQTLKSVTEKSTLELSMTPEELKARPPVKKTEGLNEPELVASQLNSQIVDSQDKYRHLDSATGNQVCNICGKQFKNLMSISTHLRRVHHVSRKPIRKYTCTVCGRDFVLQSKLNTHMHTHEGQSIECKQCGKVLRGKYILEKHIRVVHHRRYMYYCSTCGRGFEKQRCLKEHCCGRRGIDPWQRNQQQTKDLDRTCQEGQKTCEESMMEGSLHGNTYKDACEAMLALSKTLSDGNKEKDSNTNHTPINAPSEACSTSKDGDVTVVLSEVAAMDDRADGVLIMPSNDTIKNEGHPGEGKMCKNTAQTVNLFSSQITTDHLEEKGHEVKTALQPPLHNKKLGTIAEGNETTEQRQTDVKMSGRGTMRSRVYPVSHHQRRVAKNTAASSESCPAATTVRSVTDVMAAIQSPEDGATPVKRSRRTRHQPTWLQAYNS